MSIRRRFEAALAASRFAADESLFRASEEDVGKNGITLGDLNRTAFQKIQIDYVRLERISGG